MLASILIYFQEFYPGDGPEELSVRLKSGRKVRLSFPPTLKPSGEEEGGYRMTPCKADILELLESNGKPMKREIIKRKFATAKKTYSDSTIEHSAAELVREEFLVRTPEGYAFPEWETTKE